MIPAILRLAVSIMFLKSFPDMTALCKLASYSKSMTFLDFEMVVSQTNFDCTTLNLIELELKYLQIIFDKILGTRSVKASFIL